MSKLEWEIQKINNEKSMLSFISDNYEKLDTMDWLYIQKSLGFSEKVMKKYQNNLIWKSLCVFNQIPTELIEKNIDKVDWFAISTFQNLPLSFITKYKHRLSLDKLANNPRTSKSIIDKVVELYKKYDDPPHHKVWDENLGNCKIIAPKNFTGHYNDYDEDTPYAYDEKLYETYMTEFNKKKKEEEVEKKKTSKIVKQSTKKETKKSEKIIEDKNKETKPVVKRKTTKKKVEKIDYSKLSKQELKDILVKRGIKPLYHDTIKVLIEKCEASESI